MMMARRAVVASAVVWLAVAGVASAVSCLDNDGHSVDWFFTYKLPDGYSIAYVDSTTAPSARPLTLYPVALNETVKSSMPALLRTLEALSSPAVGAEYLLYNDEPPNGTASSTYGHAKGVVAIAPRTGFWLTHSTPRWPLGYGATPWIFEQRETTYGQTYLCVSLSSSEVDTVAHQLLYIRPFIYATTITSEYTGRFANLAALLAGKWVTSSGSAGTSIATLKVGGQSFTHLAKTSEWDSDLYEDLVAPHFKADLLVESWMRGEKLGPYCRPQYTWDVTDVSLMHITTPLGGANITWKETQDHAKWCVSPVQRGLVCVADENRMTSQRKRGGGALCQRSEALYDALFYSITTAAQCP